MGGSDCELLRVGWLAQPVNAMSSGAYLVVAVWLLARRWRAPTPLASPPLLVPAAAVLIAVSFGSFAFHGPQPGWARGAHDGSIAVLLAVVGVAVELRRRRGLRPLPASAVAALGVAGAFYLAGRTGSPLCSPASIAQAHAVWHVLTAAAAGLFFRR